ncbi:MAG: hypothetical protein ACRCY4_04980, partial [Brevinema sp.]
GWQNLKNTKIEGLFEAPPTNQELPLPPLPEYEIPEISWPDSDLTYQEPTLKGDDMADENCIEQEKMEGVVYVFQSDKSWDKVDILFKENVLKAMRDLYCQYKKEDKEWAILQISSAYRDAKDQARVMIDGYLHEGRRRLSEIYGSSWDNAVNLISDLYYDGSHLGCDYICSVPGEGFCKYNTQQKQLLNALPLKEQNIFKYYTFKIYIDFIKRNKDMAKQLLEEWIKVSGNESKHKLGKALDFSSATPIKQREDVDNVLQKYDLIIAHKYPEGHFHVEPI